MATKVSPTTSRIRAGSRRGRKTAPRRSPGPRREQQTPPEIYVRAGEGQWSGRYHRAHLRNRRGYLELCWRDGERVRSFYLGKAAKKFPTPAIAHQVDQLAGARRPIAAARRAKTV